MGMKKIAAGDGYRYLTRQVAAHDHPLGVEAGGLGAYYEQHGETPGVWLGAGLAGLGMKVGAQVSESQMVALFGFGRHPVTEASLGRPFPVGDGGAEFTAACRAEYVAWNRDQGRPARAAVPDEVRARIRTDLATRQFAQRHGRPPAGARELSGFLATASRPATTSVAGYDLTFSPVKSVSALWALATPEISQQVAAAHQAAVAGTMRWVQDELAYTRRGAGGVRQVNVRGLIAASFTHRISRDGDPDLHTHVAVSNKVQTLDGKWLALDGRPLHQSGTAASERYNTLLEAELVARLGVRFVDVTRHDGKRCVREIDGMDPKLLKHWSQR